MNVYEVNARFMRRAQVREYEPVEAEIAVKAQLVEGENAENVMADLLSKAKNSVYDTLGIKKPTTNSAVSSPVVNTPTSTPAPVQQVVEKVVEQNTGVGTAVVNATPAGEPARRGRGRPPGSGKKQEVTSAAAAAEIPGDEPTAQTSTPAAQAAANDIPDDVPSNTPAAASGNSDVTSKDIAAIIHKSLVKKFITTAEVKGLMTKHKVARLGDIPNETIGPFYADLAALPGMKGKLEGAKLAE